MVVQRTRRPPWRFTAVRLAIMASMLGALATVTAPPIGMVDSAASTTNAVADGSWNGSLVYDAQASWPEVVALASASASFDMVVSGGIVTGGAYEFSASGVGASDTIAGVLTFTGIGGMGGDATTPIIEPTSMSMTGTAFAQGIEVPISYSASGDQLTSTPLEIYQASCEEVSGSFVQQIAEAVAGTGGTGSFFGNWFAIRFADPAAAGAPDTLQAYEDLIDEIIQLQNAVKNGNGLEPYKLLQLADRAEQLMATAELNEECHNLAEGAGDVIFDASSVAVADLIHAALQSSSSVSLQAMQNLVSLGLRTGVLQANAAEGTDAYDLDVELNADFDLRLTAALGPPVDTPAVQQIMLTALTMGWSSVAEKAAGAL
jgi:hypothetical protein